MLAVLCHSDPPEQSIEATDATCLPANPQNKVHRPDARTPRGCNKGAHEMHNVNICEQENPQSRVGCWMFLRDAAGLWPAERVRQLGAFHARLRPIKTPALRQLIASNGAYALIDGSDYLVRSERISQTQQQSTKGLGEHACRTAIESSGLKTSNYCTCSSNMRLCLHLKHAAYINN
jgi:hypothetical protein